MSASELKELVELLTSRPAPPNASVAELRERFEKLGNYLPAPAQMRSEPLDANGVPAELVSVPGADPDRRVLYLHGGGYVIGSIDTHRTLACNLAEACGCPVLLIDYRRAPEHPFPAQLEDALSAYEWLLDQGHEASKLAIAGDSAGGGLTVSTLVALKQRGLPMPGAGLCISPWVDLEGIGGSMQSKAEVDPIVERGRLLKMAEWFLGGTEPRAPLAAPMYADLSGLPPLLVQVGSAETLLDDSTRLAEKARQDGVDITLEEAPDMIHVWHLFAPMLSEGREAISRAGAFLRERTGAV
ncbi:MAG: alpha/beta hydrolase [Gammaproteobacteria bacterium]|nr:alpha/beta hydrolase [Gammaproteobacteria bacterium]